MCVCVCVKYVCGNSCIPLFYYLNFILFLSLPQTDLQAAEERAATLTSTLHTLRAEVKGVEEDKVEGERRLQGEVERLKEDVETLKWQLGQKEAREEELMGRLVRERERERVRVRVRERERER